MSDRVAIMHDGCIEQLGSPQEVYERPRTEFVADFVGASNRIPGVVSAVHDDGTYDAELDGIGHVRAPGIEGLRPGRRVCAVVRPESIAPAGETAEVGVQIPGRVVDLAYLGDRVSCVVEVAGGAQLMLILRERHQGLALEESCVLHWPFAATWLIGADDLELPHDQP